MVHRLFYSQVRHEAKCDCGIKNSRMQNNPNKFSFDVNTFDILLTLLVANTPEGYDPELAEK